MKNTVKNDFAVKLRYLKHNRIKEICKIALDIHIYKYNNI